MRFVEGFFSNLREILGYDFIFSGFVLKISEFVCLADCFDDILELHGFSDFLNIDC